jgi:hypothetical protein
MMKYILISALVLSLFACSLPTRAPVTPTSYMVNPERSGPPLKIALAIGLRSALFL